MAVTAHWIEEHRASAAASSKFGLQLQSRLVGFERIPGRHDGEHISAAFEYVINRLGITRKVHTLRTKFHLFSDMSTLAWLGHMRQCVK
jgi:hypothetical protein